MAQRAERRTLQRRWSTFQMNVDQLNQPAPTVPEILPNLSLAPALPRVRPGAGRTRSGDVSATIDEQTEGENSEAAVVEAAAAEGDLPRRNIGEIPRSLTLSVQRFNNNGNNRTTPDVETSPSVVSSYLGDDSCHQLSAIHLQDMSASTSDRALVSTTIIANDNEDDDDEVEDDGLHLITCTLQRLPLKDFGAEVRPAVDITQFLQQSVLLLDVTENSPSDLVDLLLSRMVPSVAEEAKMILFTHDTGTGYYPQQRASGLLLGHKSLLSSFLFFLSLSLSLSIHSY